MLKKDKRGGSNLRKKNIVFLLLGVLSMVLVIGCSPNDPIPGSLYTQDIAPGTSGVGDYDVGEADNPYTDGYFGGLTLSGNEPLLLVDDGLVYLEFRPDIDFETVRAQGKPTWVKRGIVGGWSLPIFAADNEELYMMIHIPHRWDGASDITIHIHCYIDTANANKNFNVQFSWENFTDGDVIPATSNDLAEETATGAGPQYMTYHIDYIIDYDIDPAHPLVSTDELHFRVRRLNATVDEIAGEIVITHIGVVFRRDTLGSSTP